MKHTPGPWKVIKESQQTPGGEVIMRRICYEGRYGNVCLCINTVVSNPDYGEAEGNAYLQAAAPDLLAACKQALADLQAGHQYIRRQPDAVDATILTLEAAIAKAEK